MEAFIHADDYNHHHKPSNFNNLHILSHCPNDCNLPSPLLSNEPREIGSSLNRFLFGTVGFSFNFWYGVYSEPGEEMRIVGLTGGIASGKSTVSNLFKVHGIPVVDADLVARDVLKKGSGGWRKVVAAFGNEILLDNGEVDRAKLGQIVFSDPGKRQLLNRLLAPFISSGIFWEVFKLWMKGFKVIVLDVPLLFEAKMDGWTKPIIVVWVDPETQLQRLLARDRTSEEDARNRINAQMSLDLKRSKADIVIDNTGSLEDLNEQFQNVLFQVKRPLTWTEFGLSRQGAFSVLLSVTIGVLICRKFYNNGL